MGLRFRRTFRVLPGVRINLSGSGISTSLGVPGATLNLSSRGARATVGIPGTGLSYSQHLGGGRPPKEDWPESAAPWSPPAPPPSAPSRTARAIGSGELATRTSPALQQLKSLIVAAEQQRKEATADLGEARKELSRRTRELAIKRFVLWRWAFRVRLASLHQELIPEAKSEIDRLQAWVEASRVKADFNLGAEVAGTYAALTSAFSVLAGCEKVWDHVADQDVDRPRERSTASRAITRVPVKLELARDGVLDSQGEVPRFGNANGEDIYLYPALLLMPGRDGDFALIELAEVHLNFEAIRFIEDDPIPSDAEVVGQAWAKANKDGSRDQRFKDNRQIPICLYGGLRLTSPTGLNEEYALSDAKKLLAFGTAYDAHMAALTRAKAAAA